MVSARVRRPSLLIPLLVSLMVHAGGGVIGARWAIGSAPSDARADAPRPDPADDDPAGIEPEPEQLRLGMDDGEATTITWLGFSEFKEHFADPSEVDQPALALDPAGNAGPEGIGEASVPSEEPPAPPSEIDAEPIPADHTADAAPREREFRHASPSAAPPAAPPAPIESAPSDEPLPEGDTEPPTQSPEADAGPPLAPPQDSATPDPLLPIPPSAVLPPEAASGGAGEDGAESDRESTAASILTAEWKKLGQPLAGKGLEIKTRRPRLTHYTRIMGAARDPVVRVHFRRDGRVDKVELLLSSGNPDVDRPVIDAVFEWRAAGKPLQSVPLPSPPGTLAVEFKILMGG